MSEKMTITISASSSVSSTWAYVGSPTIIGGNTSIAYVQQTAKLPAASSNSNIRQYACTIPKGAIIDYKNSSLKFDSVSVRGEAKSFQFDADITGSTLLEKVVNQIQTKGYIKARAEAWDIEGQSVTITWREDANGSTKPSSAGGTVTNTDTTRVTITIVYELVSQGKLTKSQTDDLTVEFSITNKISSAKTHTLRWSGTTEVLNADNADKVPLTYRVPYSAFGDNSSLVVKCYFTTELNDANHTTNTTTLSFTLAKPATQDFSPEEQAEIIITHKPVAWSTSFFEWKEGMGYMRQYSKMSELSVVFPTGRQMRSVSFDSYALTKGESIDGKERWVYSEPIELPASGSTWKPVLVAEDENGAWKYICPTIDIATPPSLQLVEFNVYRCNNKGENDNLLGTYARIEYTVKVPEGQYFTGTTTKVQISQGSTNTVTYTHVIDAGADSSEYIHEGGMIVFSGKHLFLPNGQTAESEAGPYDGDSTPSFILTFFDPIQRINGAASVTLTKSFCTMHMTGNGYGVAVGTFSKGTPEAPEFRCAFPFYFLMSVAKMDKDGNSLNAKGESIYDESTKELKAGEDGKPAYDEKYFRFRMASGADPDFITFVPE